MLTRNDFRDGESMRYTHRRKHARVPRLSGAGDLMSRDRFGASFPRAASVNSTHSVFYATAINILARIDRKLIGLYVAEN
jgi:hypothetical protein